MLPTERPISGLTAIRYPLLAKVVGPAGFEPATKGFTLLTVSDEGRTISSPAMSSRHREGAGRSSL